MKKFMKWALVIGVFIFVLSTIVSYNNRPLAFEGAEYEPTNTQNFGQKMSDKVEDWMNTASEKASEFELPEISLEKPSNTNEALKTAPSDSPEIFKDLKVGSVVADNYDRDLFGSAWKDIDNNGCDTRNDILNRDLEKIVKKDSCKVVEGVLKDDYTGRVIEHKTGNGSRSKVQIDHIIPLSYAFKMGANDWSKEKKEAFANDPLNLKAVNGSDNMAKSDKGPSEWMPSNKSYNCDYAVSFAKVAVTYELPVTANDFEVINSSC